MDRIDLPTPTPSPAPYPTAPLPPAAQAAVARLERALTSTAWDDNDNKPVIPKIPKPRKPSTTGRRVIAAGYVRRAPQPTPNPAAATHHTQATLARLEPALHPSINDTVSTLIQRLADERRLAIALCPTLKPFTESEDKATASAAFDLATRAIDVALARAESAAGMLEALRGFLNVVEDDLADQYLPAVTA